MAINLSHLIFRVTRKLNDIGIEHYDPKLTFEDLTEAYNFIVQLSDYFVVNLADLREESVKQCLVNLAVYYGYRTYTRLAERNLGTMPESSSLQVAYDQNTARTCLEYLFGVRLNDDLSPQDLDEQRNPIGMTLGPSTLRDANS
jgi:hypothetical protein